LNPFPPLAGNISMVSGGSPGSDVQMSIWSSVCVHVDAAVGFVTFIVADTSGIQTSAKSMARLAIDADGLIDGWRVVCKHPEVPDGGQVRVLAG